MEAFHHIAFQREIGALRGRVHWQGIVTFGPKERLSADQVRERLGWNIVDPADPFTVFMQPRRADFASALKYCLKEDTRDPVPGGEFREYGVRPQEPIGDRWSKLNQLVEAGATMDELRMADPELVMRNWGSIQKAREAAMKKLAFEYRKIEVIALIGSPRTGKSTAPFIIEGQGKLYKKFNGPTYNQFDGYEGEEAILFDEFHPDDAPPLKWMNEVLDGHVFQMNVKGTSTWAHFKRVYITSNFPLSMWYPHVPKQARDAFLARINHVVYMYAPPHSLVRMNEFLDWYPHRNDPVPQPLPRSLQAPISEAVVAVVG